MDLNNAIRGVTPRPVLALRRRLLNFNGEEPLRRLVFDPPAGLSRRQGMRLARRLLAAHENINCAHTHEEMDEILRAIFATPPSAPGCIVEAGCFKGGSTAKLSIAAAMTGRRLVAFDSFEGFPDNSEAHGLTTFGEVPDFSRGKYRGTFEEVSRNVERFGEPGACALVRGWFDRTMPHFTEPIAVAFIDVDLQSSTRTCLKHLYPLLTPGGLIFSHDGHLPLCAEVMDDPGFWMREAGCARPKITGLNSDQLVRITRP